MSNAVKEITLTPSQADNGRIQWAMSYGGKGYSPGDYPKISLEHDTGAHPFEFTIAPNPWNITFKSGTGVNSPIYIQEIQGTNPSQKPTPGVVNNQIVGVVVVDNGTELQFVDRNHGAKKTLTYQLNFNNADPLDPIIENGGGGGNNQYYAMAAILAFSVLAYIAGRWLVRLSARNQGPR